MEQSRDSGLWEKILAHLVEKIRKDAGKSAEPHYALIDSQSVKTVADNEKRGIDGGKKAKGRKRHAVIDTMGNLLGIVVHAANIHDTKSGILAAQKACKKYPSIQAFCADAGYRGTCIDEVKVTPHNSAADRLICVNVITVVSSKSCTEFGSRAPNSINALVGRSAGAFSVRI